MSSGAQYLGVHLFQVMLRPLVGLTDSRAPFLPAQWQTVSIQPYLLSDYIQEHIEDDKLAMNGWWHHRTIIQPFAVLAILPRLGRSNPQSSALGLRGETTLLGHWISAKLMCGRCAAGMVF